MTIKIAAQNIGVSEATIRNWIKLGYIKKDNKGAINEVSYNNFINENVGKDKLISRANKLNKDKKRSIQFDIKKWVEYENTLSESERNKNGVYYTPNHIVENMVSLINKDGIENKTFLDPCCGSGNFIIEALKCGFNVENVYGYDIDPNAVEITKYRIKELTGVDSLNIKVVDFFELDINHSIKYDFIFTNPPWGVKMDRKRRLNLGKMLNAGNSLDSSALFLFKSLEMLKDGGKLGFFVQDALFNIGTFEDVRRKISSMDIEYLIDYGKPYKMLMTKTKAAIFNKNKRNDDNNIICINVNNIQHLRSATSFTKLPQNIFNFNIKEKENDIIFSLFKKPHITLKNNATWGMGIVTGDNKRFLSNTKEVGYVEIYRGSDITNGGLKPCTTYTSPNLEIYQQAASSELYNAKCKIVYKFISNKLHFYCDKEQKLFLNSANFFILNDDFSIEP